MFTVIRKGAINATTDHRTYKEAVDTVKLEGANWPEQFHFYDTNACGRATDGSRFYQAWNIYLKPETKREKQIRLAKQALVGIDQSKTICGEAAKDPHLSNTVTKEIQDLLSLLIGNIPEIPYTKLFQAIDVGLGQEIKLATRDTKNTDGMIKFEHNNTTIINPFRKDNQELSYEQAIAEYTAEKVNRWIDQAHANRNRTQ